MSILIRCTSAALATFTFLNPAIACDAEPAFGVVARDAGPQLGDFCVDRDAGALAGPVSLSGLTLVMDDGVNFTFEDLAKRSGNLMQIAPVLTATYHGAEVDDQSPEVNAMVGGEFVVGFLYDDLAAPEGLAENFLVYVADAASITQRTPLGFTGEARFENGTATIALEDNTEYGTAKGTEGTLTLTVAADGSVTGNGAFSTRNIRSAGYSANEWVSMQVTIDALRGFATGPTGQVIKTYALASADIVDAEGDARKSSGYLEIFLFDPKIWE